MEYIFLVLGLIGGIAIGGGGVWVFLQAKIKQAYERAKNEHGSEKVVTLTERLQNKEQQIQELREIQAQQQSELESLRRMYMEESERRATAEQRSTRIAELEALLQQKEAQIADHLATKARFISQLTESETRLAEERKAAMEKIAVLKETEQQLVDTFKALAADALQSNNHAFMFLANNTLERFQEGARSDLEKRQQSITELVQPIRESLDKFDSKIQVLETARVGAYEALKQQVGSLLDAQRELRSETSNLVNALRAPNVRGRWGEMQLKRVVEMAGMLNHCDFYEQESIQTENGRQRPDVRVQLPSQKNIIIDAKAPLEAYLEALEAPDEETRKAKLQDHARQIRTHITTLSRKAYWEQFQHSPEFVVLFLPGEVFFSAALEHDPTLIEAGIEQKIIIATPTTLIALLRAVAYGWRQETITQSVKEISDLGRDLYKRIAIMSSYWTKLSKNLKGTVEAYNQAVGSLEAKVLPSVRRFRAYEVTAISSGDIEQLQPIELMPRELQAPEMVYSDVQQD